MEYLLTMAFAVLITAPLLILYYTQASSLSQQTDDAAAQRAAQTLADAADTVYYLGYPSARTVTITLPRGVQEVGINGTAFIVALTDNDAVSRSSVTNLTGAIDAVSGTRDIVLSVLPDGRVNVSEA